MNLTGLIPPGASSIQVAFKNTNRGGVNIFLDDINIYKVLHNDAGIAAVVYPSPDACLPTFSPKVVLANFGINPLSSTTIYYRIGDGAVQSFAWSGNIAYEQTDTVTLPAVTATSGSHKFVAYTSAPNGQSDEVASNDTVYASFRVMEPVALTADAVSTESFEDPTFVPDQWRLADSVKPHNWARISPDVAPGFVAASGTGAAFVDTYDNDKSGDLLDLYSPLCNTANADTVKLSFSRAAADYYGTGATTDTLKVLLTTDCGETFSTIYSKTGAGLTTSPVTGFFYPTSPDEWEADTVNVSDLVRNAGNYRFVFRVVSTYNNNVLIDNVQVHTKSAGALPIRLISFTGYHNGSANELRWQTGAAAGAFIIERSTNGRDFTSIGTVNADTTETVLHFSDNDLSAPRYYYRLLMADADGQITYSGVIFLASNTDGLQLTSFYPSPLKGNTGYFGISADRAKTVRMMVTDMAGRRLKAQTSSVVAGFNKVPVMLGNLPAGIYLLKVTDDKNVPATIRFVKE